MGNATVAEKLPGADQLDELHRLDGSEPEPEPDPEPEPEPDKGDTDEGKEEFKPEGIPHG